VKYRFLSATCFVALAACNHEAPPVHVPPPTAVPSVAKVPEAIATTMDAPFRAKAPEAGPEPTFAPPTVVEAHLKNGLPVYLISRPGLPLVSLQLVARGGAALPGLSPGIATFATGLLSEGTKKRSAAELADYTDSRGLSFYATADFDAASIGVKGTSDTLPEAVGLLAELALEPGFRKEDVERERARRVHALDVETTRLNTMGNAPLANALFGASHPYGVPLIGTKTAAAAWKTEEVAKAHSTLFAPGRSALFIAGNFDTSVLLPLLEKAFARYAPPGKKVQTAPAIPASSGTAPRLVFIDKPGAPQAQLAVAKRGTRFLDADYFALAVGNELFGGAFSSRINLNLREKNAFTYGARSSVGFRHGDGPFVISTGVFVDKTAPAIREIFQELQRLSDQPPNEEELALAKGHLRLTLPARFETNDQVASSFAQLFIQEFPLTFYATRNAKIDAVTPAAIQAAAKKLLDPKLFTVVIVGDGTKILPTLPSLNLGAPLVVDGTGAPVAAASTK